MKLVQCKIIWSGVINSALTRYFDDAPICNESTIKIAPKEAFLRQLVEMIQFRDNGGTTRPRRRKRNVHQSAFDIDTPQSHVISAT